MSVEQLQNQLRWSKKQTSYAWAKYYDECATTHTSDRDTYEQLSGIGENSDVPQFVKDELVDLLAKLKKKIECPICYDVMEAKDIAITNCGHKYCKTCLEKLKITTKKCAVCRKKIAK